MDQLIDSLAALLRHAGDAAEVKEAAATAAWNHVAGEALRRHTVPVRLQNKKLTVAVADTIWRQQLQSMTGPLLFRLNALLGQGVITFIEFRVEPEVLRSRREQQAPLKNASAGESFASQPFPIELVSAAASIHDQDLRRAFLGAASSCVRRLEER